MTPATLSGRKILLIVGGGIAAYTALELVRLLKKAGADDQQDLPSGQRRWSHGPDLAIRPGNVERRGTEQEHCKNKIPALW